MATSDLTAQLLLGQATRQRVNPRGALAQRLMATGADTSPVYSPMAALARALTGGIGGYMAGVARDEDRAEQDAGVQRVQDFENQRRERWASELAGLDGNPVPEEQQGPSRSAVTGDARMQALAQLAGGGNPMAAPMLQTAQWQAQNDLAERRHQQQIRAQEAAAARAEAAAARAGQETFGAPVVGTGPDGQQRVVQVGSRGTIRDVQGFTPRTAPTTGFSPVWMQGPNGMVPALPTNDGRFIAATPPEGMTFLPPTRDIRLGDRVETVATPGGNAIAPARPIDSFTPAAQGAAGRAVGEQQGTTVANAPEALRTAETMLGQIDAVLNHRAFNIGTGMTGTVARNVPGTPGFDFGQRVEQLQGQAFLQAFERLRGGGAITEVEGTKATQAIARLNAATGARDFQAALNELREIVEGARARAAGNAQRQVAPAAVIPGTAQEVPGGAPIGATGLTATPPPRVRTYNPTTGRLE